MTLEALLELYTASQSCLGARLCRVRYEPGKGGRQLRTSVTLGSIVRQWRPPVSGPLRAQ